MNTTRFQRSLSLILCVVLIAAMALTAVGCSNAISNANSQAPYASGSVLGEGATTFDFTVVDAEGKEASFTVKTDKATVGEALLDVGMIAGEKSEYGLYVKTVNGTTVDYDKDGKYWAFYVDGEYAMTGVDMTDIAAGSTYTFKVE